MVLWRLVVAAWLVPAAPGLFVGPGARGMKRSGRSAGTSSRRQCSLKMAAGSELPAVPALFRGRSNRAAVWHVAWPSVTIGLLRTMLGQVDAYMIGRLGSAQLQAIGAASFAVWMVYILGELASVGVHALSSEAEGAGNRDGIGEAIAQGLWFSLATSLAMLVVGRNSIVGRYFRAMGVTETDVTAAGVDYVHITAAYGSLPLSASACASAGFKGIGETKDALWIAAAAVVLNVCLNVPFIARWGVAGAAWATNVSALAACLVSLLVLRVSHGVSVRPRRPSPRAMRRVAAIGAPLASSGALFTCVYVVLGRLLATMGEGSAYLGALGVGHRIEAVAYTVNEGFAVGCATCVGQWLGAKRPSMARAAAGAANALSVAVMVPVALLTFATAETTSAIFTTDATVLKAAASYLKIVSFCFPLMAVEFVYEGALTGAQRTLPAFFASLFCNCLRVPLGMVLLRRFGAEGIWLAISLTTSVKALAKWLFFKYITLPGEPGERSSARHS